MKFNVSFAALHKWLRPASVLISSGALIVACAYFFAPMHAQSAPPPTAQTQSTSSAQSQSTQSQSTQGAQSQPPQGTQSQAAAKSYPELPNGPGKEQLIRVCSQCHSPDNVMAYGQTQAGWQDLLQDMAGRGANGSDDDFEAILNYLTTNFPQPTAQRVNVNSATSQQLATQLNLTQQEAQAIVQYRQANGNFKTFSDLMKVPNVDPKKLTAVAAKIAF